MDKVCNYRILYNYILDALHEWMDGTCLHKKSLGFWTGDPTAVMQFSMIVPACSFLCDFVTFPGKIGAKKEQVDRQSHVNSTNLIARSLSYIERVPAANMSRVST